MAGTQRGENKRRKVRHIIQSGTYLLIKGELRGMILIGGKEGSDFLK